MAGATRSDDYTIVAELGIREVLRGVAGVAGSHRRQVLYVLDHIIARQPQTAGVTTGAILGRTLEDAIHVAIFAPRIRMHTRKGEASFEVIKILDASLRHSCSGKKSQGKCK
jgi:hypothetical protein